MHIKLISFAATIFFYKGVQQAKNFLTSQIVSRKSAMMSLGIIHNLVQCQGGLFHII
jgi:hypothetical protein